MARNKITSDMISRRLGASGTPSGNGGGRRPPVQPVEPDDEDEGKTFTPGFVMTLLALCLIVGGGTFFFAGSGVTMEQLTKIRGSDPLVSSVDAKCKEKWVPGAKNDQALMCYLTSDPSRLCDENERAHLAMVFREYRTDIVMRRNSMSMAGFKAAGIGQRSMTEGNIEVMTASIEDAGKSKQRHTPDQVNKAWDAHAKNIKKMEDVVNTPELNRAWSVPSVPRATILATIRKLGEAGYVAEGDFGWFVDELVTEALNGVKVIEPACKG